METLPKRWYNKKRYTIPLAILGIAIFASAYSTPPAPTQSAAVSAYAAPTQPQQAQGSQVQLSNNNYYTNVSGQQVHSPAYAPAVPPGATAQCRDGSYSFSQHHSGTCSHHGGVATWF